MLGFIWFAFLGCVDGPRWSGSSSEMELSVDFDGDVANLHITGEIEADGSSLACDDIDAHAVFHWEGGSDLEYRSDSEFLSPFEELEQSGEQASVILWTSNGSSGEICEFEGSLRLRPDAASTRGALTIVVHGSEAVEGALPSGSATMRADAELEYVGRWD